MAEPADSIIFVVDGKTLESMSLVLAASLARHHRVGVDVRVIAYVSARSMADLSPATQALYKACGVEMAALPSAERLWKKPYPHGNKLLAAASRRTSQRTTFLDTDMVVQAPITDLAPVSPYEVFVVPEGRPTWGNKVDAWQRAYRFFDLPFPEVRISLTRGRQKEFLPYFNAGYVSFSDLALEDDGRTFGQLWLEFARRFDWHCIIANKRPWLDQITLPLVMAQYGLDCALQTESFNYSTSERADLSQAHLARIVHYHRAAYFNAMPNAVDHLDAVRVRTPARHQAGLEEMLELFTKTPARDYAATGAETEMADDTEDETEAA